MDNIKDLLSRLGLMCRLEYAIVKELEDQAARIKALEENRKLKDATILKLQQEIGEMKLILRKKV